MDQHSLMGVSQVTDMCETDHQTVLGWIKEGKLKASRTQENRLQITVRDLMVFLMNARLPVPVLLSPFVDTFTKRILIVDDDPVTVTMINRILFLFGKYTFETAKDGREATQKFDIFQPDLVTVDINMPGVNGIELCAMLRKDARYENIKILAVSSTVEQDQIDRILQAGANAFIPKPFDAQALVAKIKELLNLSD